MRKKILFVVTYLNTGGIIRSLQNFLNCYDSYLYDVDVFALVHQGVFDGKLDRCSLLPRMRLIESSVAHIENQQGWSRVESLLLKIADKATNYRCQRLLFRKGGSRLLKRKKYDAVIGYSESLPTLMVSMMNHLNKIGWIHCDYANYLKVGNGQTEFQVYDALQSIVCVSNYTRDSFLNVYPSFGSRTHAIYNIIDDKMMREKSMEPIEEPFDKTCFNIVSVGRIDPVKRLSIVPALAKKLNDAGCIFRWYVIGPKGTQEEVDAFFENIQRYRMDEMVLPLGEKANPYPYIAKADLLVNTSISEACPYVVNEAKILGTPVVCTDFGSAKEFIDSGENGYYEPIEKISERIIWLINNPNELTKLKNNLKDFSYDNDKILKQIYGLIR